MGNDILETLTDKKKLREQGLIIVDTEKILKDLIKSDFKLKCFLCSQEGRKITEKYGITENVIKIKPSLVRKLSDVETNQGFVAVFERPSGNKADFYKEKKLVLFDTIQDPANAGAMIRSGVAFGFETYLFLDSVYIFNDKTIRSSAGVCFTAKYSDVTFNDVKKLKENDFRIITTDPEKGKDVRDVKNGFADKFVIVFGNEGKGIRNEIMKISDERIKIDYPNKKVESLNVSTAAGILFYEIYNILNGGSL
ncbi:MAG TPA: RNA methyltransferase [Candidatus Goldiibacteriota bacterium]|nr:RNA methyltransferase [Candidatus Goldiibacteriota bacterium]